MGENLTTGLKDFGEFACSFPDCDLVAAWGPFDAVHVFSVSGRRLVGSLATVFTRGGRRLALVEAPEPTVVAGAWARHGVAGYRIDGELLWQRRDLKQPQHLSPVGAGRVAVGMSMKMMHVVDASSGETVRTVRGADSVFHDGRFGLIVVQGRGGFVWGYEAAHWEAEWKIRLGGVLDVAFSDRAILVTGSVPMPRTSVPFPEPKGVVCLDSTGKVAWTWEPEDHGHVIRIAWNRRLDSWAGLFTTFDRRPPSLLVWSREGNLESTELLPPGAFSSTFAGEGSLLITGAGDVLDVPSARRLWRLAS